MPHVQRCCSAVRTRFTASSQTDLIRIEGFNEFPRLRVSVQMGLLVPLKIFSAGSRRATPKVATLLTRRQYPSPTGPEYRQIEFAFEHKKNEWVRTE